MAIADKASVVSMPPGETRFIRVLDFLVWKFPLIAEAEWRIRMQTGKVHREGGSLITVDDLYQSHQRVFYYREVAEEPVIPFAEEIVYQDEHLLVACKPHFLTVTPGGPYVQECLLNRLRSKTGIEHLAPVHRIDRETAGLVMFSVKPETRSDYHDLFVHRRISKCYQAVVQTVEVDPKVDQRWLIENRMEIAEPRFRMKIVEGEINARSKARCLAIKGDTALFELEPVSGKRHQLRVHMSSVAMPLVNDRYYPELQDKVDDNYQKPLQLLAKSLRFTDPVTGDERYFQSKRQLSF